MRDYIWHAEDDALKFFKDYFTKSTKILYIGSIGFDPRTLDTYKQMEVTVDAKITPYFISEDRAAGDQAFKKNAQEREQSLPNELGFSPDIDHFKIFASDGASIGGSEVIKLVGNRFPSLEEFSDVVVDICAMSRGIFFPLVRYLKSKISSTNKKISLHILVVDQPAVDYAYLPNYTNRADWMRGFDGGAGLVADNQSIPTKLWLPQLMTSRERVYETLHNFIAPDDVCPILPFPGIVPKMVDNLLVEYAAHIVDAWEVDLQNIALAAESDPLDMYNTVCKVDNERKKIFDNHKTVLSPMGSKVSTIGGLLAAMDLDLPVAYVEPHGYFKSEKDFSDLSEHKRLVHVWVDGPIYD